ncbi:MAG: conjugative relaxase, partial [Gammaproteobacteria bacterium]|nr:conjugative relaxase [Gammaproteobacteria bacterium]
MLSIEPLKSASGATKYYLNVVNYYENDSKSIRWLGEGAKALAIHGELVEKELMQALLQGMMPDGIQLGRLDKEGIQHRPGFDMTVSAPKSFSILLESGADPRLGEALDKTVEWFVSEMEAEFAQARIMVDGKIEYIDTKNFVVAAFRQPNSRANDPQSHVHLVVMNMTQCKDGKWRSLASDMQAECGVVEQIMKNHIYGGLKFRNKLANFTKELGYTLETTGDGLWEIKGVPKEVLQHFSKRREGIEAFMEDKGWQGAKAASIATQRTKTDKEIVDFAAWKKEILTTCKSFGFDALQFVARIQEPKNLFSRVKESVINQFFDKEKFQTIKGDEAVTIAIEAVSQQTAVFTPQKIKEHALKYIIASDWVVDERYIDKAMEQRIASQKLLCAQHPITQK